MWWYQVTKRLLLSLLNIIAISMLSFLIIQLPPGDYLTSYVAELASQGNAISHEQIESLRQQYGLDRPLIEQYLLWMGNLLRGDLGMSFQWNRPVAELIGERLVATMCVALAPLLLMWCLAIPIGIYSAIRKNTIGDYVVTFLGFVGLAIPDFLLALILMYAAFAWFGTSVGGLFSLEYLYAPWSLARVGDLLSHLWIPAIVLGTSGTAQLVRILRANLLDELPKPYVRTAISKGLPLWRAVLKYPVRVAMNPLISSIGYLLPYIVSGSVIVAVVLNLPTVGPLLLQSLIAQDMYLAGAIVFSLGIMTVLGTLVSDILLLLLDPRIHTGKAP